MTDDQFQTVPDPQGGSTLQPAPDVSALSPADLGLPPELLAALGPMPPKSEGCVKTLLVRDGSPRTSG